MEDLSLEDGIADEMEKMERAIVQRELQANPQRELQANPQRKLQANPQRKLQAYRRSRSAPHACGSA